MPAALTGVVQAELLVDLTVLEEVCIGGVDERQLPDLVVPAICQDQRGPFLVLRVEGRRGGLPSEE